MLPAATVQEYFEDPSHWTQGSYARDALGNSVPFNDPTATCHCLVGAIQALYLEHRVYLSSEPFLSKYTPRVVSALNQVTKGKHNNIPSFNDDPNTSIEDIRRFCQLADL